MSAPSRDASAEAEETPAWSAAATALVVAYSGLVLLVLLLVARLDH